MVSPSDIPTTLASSRWGQLTKTDFPSTDEATFSMLLKKKHKFIIHVSGPRENFRGKIK